MLKAVNFVRLLSIVIFLGTLSIVYAYLDPVVSFSLETDMPTMHRTYFFYLISLIFLIINIFLLLLIKILSPKIAQRFGLLTAGWVGALPVVVNFYICFFLFHRFFRWETNFTRCNVGFNTSRNHQCAKTRFFFPRS